MVSRDYSSLAVERHLQLVLTLTTMCKQVPQVAPLGAPGSKRQMSYWEKNNTFSVNKTCFDFSNVKIYNTVHLKKVKYYS